MGLGEKVTLTALTIASISSCGYKSSRVSNILPVYKSEREMRPLQLGRYLTITQNAFLQIAYMPVNSGCLYGMVNGENYMITAVEPEQLYRIDGTQVTGCHAEISIEVVENDLTKRLLNQYLLGRLRIAEEGEACEINEEDRDVRGGLPVSLVVQIPKEKNGRLEYISEVIIAPPNFSRLITE